MKSRYLPLFFGQNFRHLLPVCAALAALLASGPAAFGQAGTASPSATFYWDIDGNATNTGNGAYGGNGAWDTTSSFWNTQNNGTGSLTTWSATSPGANRAVFGVASTNTDAAVTIASDVFAHDLQFNASHPGGTNTTYSLSGAGIVHLSVSNFGKAVQVNNANTLVTIGNQLDLTHNTTNGTIVFELNSTSGSATYAGGINASATGTQTFKFQTFNGVNTIVNSDITKSGSSTGVALSVGENTNTTAAQSATKNNAIFTFGGNNTGVTQASSVNRGTLLLTNSNAVGTSSGLTMNNITSLAGQTVGDTAKIMIGTAGVSISTPITVITTTTNDTTDVRAIGSNITSGTATYSGTVTLGNLLGLANGLELSAASGGTTVFSGLISDGANSSKITVNGGGIVQLAKSTGNTYDGGTTVTGNTTLLASNTSGSATGTGAVTIASGSALGGTGSISGATTIDGNLNPGNSPGVITFGSDLTLAGITTMEINGTGRGTDYDGVNIGGNLTYGGTLMLNFGATPTAGATYDLFAITGSQSASFTSVSLAGIYSSAFTNNSGIWTVTDGGYDFSFSQSTGDLLVTAAIPEPSTYALIFGAIALIGAGRLRRRRNA